LAAEETMTSSTPSLTSSAPLSRVVSAHSEHSAADLKTVPGMFTQSPGEDYVNVAAVSFLTTLTMGCNLAWLEWEVFKHNFNVQLGEASICAITDGRLCCRARTDIHAIVEVKPFVLREKLEPTLMQMGLEMLAWIIDCEKNNRPKQRYVQVVSRQCSMLIRD
jgi:hypothetical protein